MFSFEEEEEGEKTMRIIRKKRRRRKFYTSDPRAKHDIKPTRIFRRK